MRHPASLSVCLCSPLTLRVLPVPPTCSGLVVCRCHEGYFLVSQLTPSTPCWYKNKTKKYRQFPNTQVLVAREISVGSHVDRRTHWRQSPLVHPCAPPPPVYSFLNDVCPTFAAPPPPPPPEPCLNGRSPCHSCDL